MSSVAPSIKAGEVKAGRYAATGKRKDACARAWLKKGKGEVVINGRPLEHYFGRMVARMVALQPFNIIDMVGKFDVTVNAKGGGKMGQAGAIRHAISQALCDYDATYRPALKKAGFLTRDSRVVERKKYGQHGARRAHQFSKR